VAGLPDGVENKIYSNYQNNSTPAFHASPSEGGTKLQETKGRPYGGITNRSPTQV